MVEYDSNGVSIDNDPNWIASGRYVGAHRSDYKPKTTSLPKLPPGSQVGDPNQAVYGFVADGEVKQQSQREEE